MRTEQWRQEDRRLDNRARASSELKAFANLLKSYAAGSSISRTSGINAAFLSRAHLPPSRMMLASNQSEWRELLAAGTPATLPSTNEEWKRVLEPKQYAVLREEATEPPGSSELNDIKESGVFLCAGCAQPLFTTFAKFESGSGWPSFWAPAKESAVDLRTDFKILLPRTEVTCSRCRGHLGHVFDDGPPPTGKRYCMNGVAMQFESATERSEEAVAMFAERAANIRPPPLVKPVLEAVLSSLVCFAFLSWFAIGLEAKSGQVWAIEAYRNYKAFLGGAALKVFGPPGGIPLLIFGAIAGSTALQKVPMIRDGLRRMNNSGM